MTFEEFNAIFADAIRRAGLPRMPFEDVRLDLGSLDRSVRIYLDPPGLSPYGPLHVGCRLSYTWDALDTARARTSESDVVGELLGSKAAMRRTRTEPRWLRLDIRLWANTEWGRPLPDPGPARWLGWRAEIDARLGGEARLVDDGDDEVDEDGPLRIKAWQGEPEATFTCGADGALRLHDVKLEAWQALDIPRKWNDDRRRQDPSPDIAGALERVAAGLEAWTASLRHLLPA